VLRDLVEYAWRKSAPGPERGMKMPLEREDARIMACPAIRLSVTIRGPLAAGLPAGSLAAGSQATGPGSLHCSAEEECEFAHAESCLLTLLRWDRSISSEPSL
jgi:hypothetical protein